MESTLLSQLLARIKRLDDSFAFLRPVDWKRLGLDDYLMVIERPMDLQSLGRRLRDGCYEGKNQVQFFEDMKLIWKNCQKYNEKKTDVYKASVRMEKNMIKLIRDLIPKQFHQDPNVLPQDIRQQLSSEGDRTANERSASAGDRPAADRPGSERGKERHASGERSGEKIEKERNSSARNAGKDPAVSDVLLSVRTPRERSNSAERISNARSAKNASANASGVPSPVRGAPQKPERGRAEQERSGSGERGTKKRRTKSPEKKSRKTGDKKAERKESERRKFARLISHLPAEGLSDLIKILGPKLEKLTDEDPLLADIEKTGMEYTVLQFDLLSHEDLNFLTRLARVLCARQPVVS